MDNFNSLKKSFGLLSAFILATAQMSCSDNAETPENSTVPESSISETTTETTETEIQETTVPTQVLSDSETEPLANTQKIVNDYANVFSDRDMNPDFDNITAEITLKGDSAECTGDGITIDKTKLTITKEGIYKFSGTLNDGQIIVNAPDAKVQIILDNADITCSTSSAIYGVDSKKIFVSLAEKSVNNLTDGETYVYDDETTQEPDACIFSHDSLTINGSGSLNINSSLTGIHSKDDIVITGGNINVNSAKDGIKGKDYIAVADGNIDITCSEDGVKSTNVNDTSLGWVYIQDGNFTINSAQDGISAETDLTIDGGNFNITSGDGSENSTKAHADTGGFGGGRFNHGDFGNMNPPDNFNPQDSGATPPDGFNPQNSNAAPPDGFNPQNSNATPPDGLNPQDSGATPPETVENSDNTTETTISTKGIKSGSSLNITGGEFNINSADDALHSANVAINSGSLNIKSGDKGIHADYNITIDGGTIDITDSYEGIEGSVINVSGGNLKVTASDDGFNASDGVTNQNGMGAYCDGVELNINGGSVYVNAEGDGLDSNGDMTINGGIVTVDGCTNGGNGALDGNNGISVKGGTLIAVGNSQMAECPDNTSTQYVISATFESTQQAGTSVKLVDESGAEIIDFTSAKTFDNIIISSPDILKDKTYTFYLNDTKSESFTATEIISTIGRQSAMGGGFGGRDKGNRGDFQPPTNENGEFEMPEKNFGGMHKIPDTTL